MEKEQKDERAAVALNFLQQIRENNNRPWFQEHKAEYETARKAFESMVEDVLSRLAEYEPRMGLLSVKDCTYRFYRDIRFSADKSPYKRHFGAYMNPFGKKSFHGGFYLHLEPRHCLLGGGAYCLPPALLRAVRQDVAAGMEEFRAVVEAPAFRSLFPVIGMEHLKTAPKGFSKDYPFLQYVRPKDYAVGHNLSDDFFSTTAWLEKTVEAFRIMKPYLDFINYTIDNFE